MLLLLEILLVEDNPGDVRLIGEVFGEENVHVVNDGAAALDYLNQRNSFSDALPPDLILLDLNLPKQSGREVLQVVKDDPSLRHIPVIILTTSATEEEICEAYRHRASCYVVKPFDLSDYMRVLGSIRQFWTTTVRLAPRGSCEGRSGTHLAWRTPSPVGAQDE